MFTRLLNLQHSQHILGVDEIIEDDTHYYVEMRVADGGELFTFLMHAVDVPERECKRLMFELLRAMDDFHRSGFVHRDIKPENVLFHNERQLPMSPSRGRPCIAEHHEMTPGSPKMCMPANTRTLKLVDFDTCVENLPVSPKVRLRLFVPTHSKLLHAVSSLRVSCVWLVRQTTLASNTGKANRGNTRIHRTRKGCADTIPHSPTSGL